MNRENKQWRLLEKVEKVLIDWSVSNNAQLFRVEFVPKHDYSVEIFIFYDSDSSLIQNQENGISDSISNLLSKTLNDIGYIKSFNHNITLIFDSNENVINNYQGSYFFRLR